MGFSDLEHGWHQKQFDLADLSISREYHLLEKSGDGEWHERSSLRLRSSKAVDETREYRFSKLGGTLSARARLSDEMDSIILGVPESKQAGTLGDEKKVEDILVHISVADSEDFSESIRSGGIGFREQSNSSSAEVYVLVFTSRECFESIRRMAIEPGVELKLALNIKGWHWTGPIGDSKAYIDTVDPDSAELASINVQRSIPSTEVRNEP